MRTQKQFYSFNNSIIQGECTGKREKLTGLVVDIIIEKEYTFIYESFQSQWQTVRKDRTQSYRA